MKDLRLARGLTLQQVAETGGLSPAHLSQIERGQSIPSVSTLLSVATALEVPAEYFLRPSNSPSSDSTASESMEIEPKRLELGKDSASLSERLDLVKIAGGIEWTRMTRSAGPVQFRKVEYAVGASSGELAYQDNGQEVGLVLQGRLLVEVAFSTTVMEPGSTIMYDMCHPHRISNIGEVPAVGIWVTLKTPPCAS